VAESSTGVLIIDYVAAESPEEEAGLTKGMFVIGVNGAQTEVVGKEKIMSLLKESEKLELDVQENYGFLSNDSRRSSVYGFEAIPIDLTKDTNPSKQIIGEDEDDSGDDEIILQRQRSGSICEGFDDGTSSNVNVSPTKFDSSQQMSSLAENKEETGSPAWRKPHIVSPIGRKPYMILSWGDQSYSRTGRESSTDPDPIPEGAPIILQTPPRSALKGSRNRKPAEGVRFNMAGEIITPGTEMESDLRERPRTPPPMVSEDEDPAVLMMRDQLTAGELSVPQYSRVVLMLYEAQSDPLVQLVRTKMLNPETTPEELVHIIAVLIRATEVLADIGDD